MSHLAEALRLSRRLASRWLGAVVVVVLLIGTIVASVDSPSLIAASVPLSVAVSGNRLVDGSGQTVRLVGVNKSGSEYACAQGWGLFDGPTGATAISAMAAWKINTVRIPLNSACWLDLSSQIGSYNSAYTGANYRNAIVAYVNRLHAAGIYAILELHWSGCGTSTGCKADSQKSMPDRPYASQFWSSVATTFHDDHAVVFDLFNEPYNVDWPCWRDGGCLANAGTSSQYTVAGM